MLCQGPLRATLRRPPVQVPPLLITKLLALAFTHHDPRSIVDAADAAFCTLPAPQGRVIPARSQSVSSAGSRAPSVASTPPPAVDMSAFMDRYGGCFAPQVTVTVRRVKDDLSSSGSGVVAHLSTGRDKSEQLITSFLQSPVKLADGSTIAIENLRPGMLTWGGARVKHVVRLLYGAVVPMVNLPGSEGNFTCAAACRRFSQPRI
jgi:hypothetical protein